MTLRGPDNRTSPPKRRWQGTYRPWRRPPPSRFSRWVDYALTIAIFGLLLLAISRMDEVSTRSNNGQAKVNDGDTLTVQGQRIRLRGIDAPEYQQTCKVGAKDYPCGRQALQALAKMVAGREVVCDGWQKDRYDRLLGDCRTVSPRLDLNAEMVRQGWAVAYGDFEAEEWAARGRGVGLWQGDFDRPRDWRADHDRSDEPAHDVAQGVINWLRQLFWP